MAIYINDHEALDILDSVASGIDQCLPSVMVSNLQKMHDRLQNFGEHDDPLVKELIVELIDHIEETGVV